MSAPDTDLERQKQRHRGPLMGMWIALAVVAVLFVGWVMFYAVSPEPDAVGGPVTKQEQTQPSN